MTTVTCRPDPKNFAYGVKQAKSLGGKYDAASKTWTIQYDEERQSFDPSRCGLIEVSRVSRNTAESELDRQAEDARRGDSGMDYLG